MNCKICGKETELKLRSQGIFMYMCVDGHKTWDTYTRSDVGHSKAENKVKAKLDRDKNKSKQEVTE